MRLVLALLSCLTPASVVAGEITVFAASSLVDALSEIATDFEAETGHSVRLSFAGTSTLAVQIALGAPADLFIAADPAWMDHVADRVVDRVDLLGNQLVLIAHGTGENSPALVTVESLADLGHGPLAMALTDAVPAGRYGRQALESLGLWGDLPVAEAANVRAALALVASGAAPMGVVYASDAAVTDTVHVLGIFDPASHPEIVYPAALLRDGGGDPEAAIDFMNAIQSTESIKSFAIHGFEVR